MSIEVVHTEPALAHLLPYAPAIRVPANSEYVYVSSDDGHVDGPAPVGLADQVDTSLTALQAALEANALGFEDIVHLNRYFTDLREADAINLRAYEFFGSSWPPAGCLIGVDSLPTPGLRVCWDAIAVRPAAAATGPANDEFFFSGATAMPLYHQHPHAADDELTIPTDIVRQTEEVLGALEGQLTALKLTWRDVF